MQYLRILPILILAFAVCGCFASKQPKQPEWGGSEEWRLKSLEENFLNFKEGLREQNTQIERNHQETTAQIDKLQERMAEIDSTLAELKENQQKLLAMKAEQDISPAETATETVVAEEVVMGGSASSEEKPWMIVPGQVAAPVESTAKTVASTPAPQSVQSAPAAQASQPAPVVQAAQSAPASSLSGDALYKEGVRLTLNNEPVEGRNLLNQYLRDNPSASLAPNALYWIGETYYSEKSFAQSILKFKEVSRRFPKANKVPDAMLKIGLAYDKLGDRENAVFYLRTLLEDYPNSDPAKIGRQRLREIEG